ncbi:hypothetical protein ACE1OI_002143 [Vibrio cholerae]|uniref:hypothetical protein n=1 Tax=Vibrio cholerae TaxID=666 RepID=UPI00027352BF|nr:hypothetical protein [Vibrio cholerae]EGQ8314619.1 hypothetical protein [Vibrio cholerae]EGR4442210.1 hypothetical protein [Vibrio cholerae]EJH67095.1 hypothetical protein VCHE25_1050 [Vibrio cholerae HE-25]ELJ8606066.1 hypothetical protein [Vibrio cholerae]KQA39133.1 hypothetical protein XV74_09450 [Vibrio cholerae]
MSNKERVIENVEQLIRVLQTHGIIHDDTPLRELVKGLKKTRSDKGLNYELIDLKFHNLSEKQFINHKKWDAKSFEVKLHLNITLLPEHEFRFGSVRSSVVEITYEAYSEVTCTLARGAWHLDFHDDSSPEFIHPNYHFHHGGRRIKEVTEDYGELVLLDAPRLMHPPLDLFLAVDMLASNFLKERLWRNLRADTTYQELIKESQNNWWMDYYQLISDYWKHQTSGIADVQKRKTAQLAIPYLYV